MADKFLHERTRDQLISNVKAIPREIGETLGAMFRAGLKDLQTVVLHAFPQQAVASHEEPGMPFMPPQYEVPCRTSEGLDAPAIAPSAPDKGAERGDR